jgi:hypothetical protein
MVMVDATGTPTDVDTICLSLVDGTGGSDGDYGSFGTGYVPTLGPATYALYDIDATDLAALAPFADGDQEYFDYVVANGTCLAESTFPVDNIPAGTPFRLCGGGSVIEVPTLGGTGLAALTALLALAAIVLVRRRARA